MKKVKYENLDYAMIKISHHATCKMCSKQFEHQELCYSVPIHDSFIACSTCCETFDFKQLRVYWDESKEEYPPLI